MIPELKQQSHKQNPAKTCNYLRIYNTVCFIKIVRPQDKKGRGNQLPLLNKNGIAWYVRTLIPIASQKNLGAVFLMQTLGA